MTQFQSGEWADVPSVGAQSPPPMPKKLNVVLPFIPSEIDQVKNLLERSRDICDQIPRNIFLIPFKGTNAAEIESLAKEAFTQVGTIKDSEGVVSDWQNGQLIRSAAGPNSLFRQAAWFFYLSNGRLGDYLWLEPDCTPIGRRWLLDLEAEYYEIGKPFMGVQMIIQDGRRYMNGVGIYPWNCIQYAPLLVQSTMWKQYPDIEVGFDVAGGFDVLKHAHMTRKIQLELKKDKIELKPETVLLHGQNLSGKHILASIQPASPQKEPEPAGSPAQPTFLGGSGVQGEPATEVFRESCSAPGDLPSHETPAQESEYGAVSKEIRFHVEHLQRLWDCQPHRKVLIVKELRKAKLVPKHFR